MTTGNLADNSGENSDANPELPNPYVGPRPFEQIESKYFFGRDEETKILSGLVVAHQLSLFYAQSGAGKSSLLRAGLLPRLTRKTRVGADENAYLYQTMHVLPIASVGRGVPPSTMGAIRNVYAFSVLLTLFPDASPSALARQTLAEALPPLLDEHIEPGAVWEPAQERNGRVRPPLIKPDSTLLIFDQFEEIFTAYPERWREREGFFRQVTELLARFPTLHVLFTMREDYLAELTPFSNLLSDDLRHRFRMERLRREGALQAVTQPAQAAGRTFAPTVAEKMVDNLRRVQRSQRAQRMAQEAATGEVQLVTSVYGEYVEPVHLQIVCRDLWDRLPPARVEIEPADLESFGDVDQALTNFYENTLAKVIAETNVTEQALRLWFNERLITPARTKGLVYRDEAKGETAGLPNAAVNILRDAWIIRSDIRGGDTWYELAHDRLVEPILNANAARQTMLSLDAKMWSETGKPAAQLYKDSQLADAARQLELHPNQFSAIEKEFIQAGQDADTALKFRRRRQIITGGALLVVIFAALTVWALYQTRSARQNEQAADIAQQEAVLKALAAETAEAEAEIARAAAVSLRVEAEAGATEAAREAVNARIAESTAVAAFAAADQERKSALKLAADIQALIQTPTATPPPSPTAAGAGGNSSDTAVPVIPPPEITPTPDLAATATIEAVVQEIDQVQSRATQAAQTEIALYALAPDANMSIFAEPDVNAERLAVVHSPDRLPVLQVTVEWAKVRAAENVEGWIRTGFFTFEGSPAALPADLQFRLVSNRADLPFVYGRVISYGGSTGDYLLSNPDNEQSGFRLIPVDWPVTLLQVGPGAQSYGSGEWGFVMLVDPDNAALIQQGWLPLEILAPRAESQADSVAPESQTAPVASESQAEPVAQTSIPTPTASITVAASEAARQVQRSFLEGGYQYEWPNGSAAVTEIAAVNDRLTIRYDHLEGELSGVLFPADDGRWRFAGQWSQGEDGGDFELIFEPDLRSATGWWNHGGETAQEAHSLRSVGQ
ncbi:MAG: SH3 domain-containing protein [Caldilineaceae bacterium]